MRFRYLPDVTGVGSRYFPSPEQCRFGREITVLKQNWIVHARKLKKLFCFGKIVGDKEELAQAHDLQRRIHSSGWRNKEKFFSGDARLFLQAD